MSFNTKLVLAGFTLALLVASHSATACERTGVWCDGNDRCVGPCRGKGSPAICSTAHVVGDPSCVCGPDCDAQADEPTTQEKPASHETGMPN
ncbi:unnamed protein product [Urochloa decumbens]|uniref:Uncharacterized protein n=1 Tax=Urochloa decumbens TaxID=240449 RepID=A0ABC9AN04_9POAL